MEFIFGEDKKIDYLVIKIGDKVYSTSYSEIKAGRVNGKVQRVKTKGIGEQTQLWVKGIFTEGKNHEKLTNEEDFEINIYLHDEDSK